MVKFQPLTKEQASNVFPKGEYKASIESCALGKSKKGADMFTLNLRVYGPDGRENLVRDYLLCDGPMAYKLRHFCESMGKLEDYEAGELYAETFQGENVVVKLGIEESDEYPAKNAVKDYLTEETKGGGKKKLTPEEKGYVPGVDPAQAAQARKAAAENAHGGPSEIPFSLLWLLLSVAAAGLLC